MDLQKQLKDLAGHIQSFHEPPEIGKEEWQRFAENTTVALTAGGESSRYAAALNGKDVNKNAHELPNGDSMIEMTIRMYRDAGIKKFVALVFHNAHSVQDRVGDGSQLGVEITYSEDPGKGSGIGGALRNALENGAISADANLIVSNPCDIFIDLPDNFIKRFCEFHVEGEDLGALATVVVVPGIPIPAAGFMIKDNKILDAQKFPIVPVPAHNGISIFSPKGFPRFSEIFELTGNTKDFEAEIFPLLAREGKLWSAVMDKGRWIQVKDLKGYKELITVLK